MSTGRSTERKNQSIVENSTLMAANLLRASCLALSEMGLGSLPGGRCARSAPIEASPPVLPQRPTMRRVETGSLSTGYVMEQPGDGNSVDTRASMYIHKVKQQNISDAGEVAMISKKAR